MMYHDMGYPSHNYAANYLTPYGDMMNTNAYGRNDGGNGGGVGGSNDSIHFMRHLSTVPTSPSTVPSSIPSIMNNSQSFSHDSMHHHSHAMAMMQTHENRTWYQPPIAAVSQPDHR